MKYYLPVEVKKENIVLVDDELSVKFDAEQNKYFVSGEFTLAPGATKTVSVTIDDAVFTISEEQVNSIRKQAEQLSEPLKSTSYFAQGVTLKSDIDVSLDKIVILQKSAITPDEKIRAYREAQIELKAAKDKTDRLKEIAELFEKGLELYRGKDWDKAQKYFEEVLKIKEHLSLSQYR